MPFASISNLDDSFRQQTTTWDQEKFIESLNQYNNSINNFNLNYLAKNLSTKNNIINANHDNNYAIYKNANGVTNGSKLDNHHTTNGNDVSLNSTTDLETANTYDNNILNVPLFYSSTQFQKSTTPINQINNTSSCVSNSSPINNNNKQQ